MESPRAATTREGSDNGAIIEREAGDRRGVTPDEQTTGRKPDKVSAERSRGAPYRGGVPILDARASISRFGSDSFVVAAGGELDLYTSERLHEKLADALEQGGRRILVDPTGVSFMDSTASGCS
jgi:hypothetical protein